MPDAPTIALSMPEPDIALLTFDAPGKGANVLSRPVLEELEAHLNQLADKKLAGLIVRSGKPGAFIAGADITEFVAAQRSDNFDKQQIVEMCSRGRKLLQRLSQAPYVTVAAIDGVCLGGGAELACWCDRRLMTDDRKAQIGFPEVKLGIYPGWGGTARVPRLVGLANAVEAVCGGEPMSGADARSMGLVTDVVPGDKLLTTAVAVIRAEQKSGQYKQDRKRADGPLPLDPTELSFCAVTANGYIQGQTKGQYPAPLAALNTMVGAATEDIEAAGKSEAEGMAELFGTPINRSLINVFFLMERNKKETGVERTDIKPGEVKSVGVFGAGIMGAGIAAAAVRKQTPVVLTDTFPAALAKGVQGILEEVSYNKALKGVDPQKAMQSAALVNATTADTQFAGCDLLIEAVIEKIEAKHELYGRIEPHLKPTAILASNTSTIPIAKLAAGLKRPENFVGIHFFNPVRQMPLVEVIRGPKTSDQTVATAVAWVKSIGKSPIVMNDGPGFLVNRLLLPYMNEALELLLEGCEIKHVDRAATNFGMPMGPITLYDVVGLDTALHAGKVMHDAFPDRVVESPLLPAMYQAGRLGQKTGVGFFKYDKNKKGKGAPDPTLADLMGPLVRKKDKLGEEQIVHRLFLPMVLEATRILEEKVVRSPRDVDLGLIFGTGFPPFKGGLLFWADTIGAAKLIELLKPLEHLGGRAKPTPMLLEMAKSGRKFYDMK